MSKNFIKCLHYENKRNILRALLTNQNAIYRQYFPLKIKCTIDIIKSEKSYSIFNHLLIEY